MSMFPSRNFLLRAVASELKRVTNSASGKRLISQDELVSLQQLPTFDEKHLLGPGPTNMHPDVVSAMTWPTRGHMHPDFWKVMDDVKAGIRYIFQTDNALTLPVSGPGHSAMECAFVNLVEPGEDVVIMRNGWAAAACANVDVPTESMDAGYWSLRAAQTAVNAGGRIHEVHAPMGEAFTLSDIEQALKEHKPKVLFIVHGESSTGVLQDLNGVAPLCHAHGCLLVVDTVASICGAPFAMDALEVDCVYAGTQKALGGPSGIAPISFNDRAWQKIQSRKIPIHSLLLDVNQLGNYWGCFDEPRRYHHTAAIQLVYGMRAALAMVAREGLHNMITRHEHNARLFTDGLHKMGLQLFVPDSRKRMNSVTTICVPPGIEWQTLVQDMWNHHNVEIWGGIGDTAGKIWRVGLMGNNSRPEIVNVALDALQQCLLTQQGRQKTNNTAASVA